MRPMKHLFESRRRAGFTLIELVVVILILTIMAGVLVPRIVDRQASARDVRRLADIRVVRDAIEQYKLDTGDYPATDDVNASFDNYDVSQDGDFLPTLVDSGYLAEAPSDPRNDATFHYRYQRYAQGSNACAGAGTFYVLAITQFETSDVATNHPGRFRCTGKDWSADFDFVTGGGASYE